VVPTLVDDGNIIIDSSVICEYLEEKYPEIKLAPEDLVQRAKMRAWMRFLEEVPTAAVRVPSFNMGFLPRYEGLSRAQFEAQQSDIRPIRKQFYRRMGPGGFKKMLNLRSNNSETLAAEWTRHWQPDHGCSEFNIASRTLSLRR
jgi:glutathione S-transferase